MCIDIYIYIKTYWYSYVCIYVARHGVAWSDMASHLFGSDSDLDLNCLGTIIQDTSRICVLQLVSTFLNERAIRNDKSGKSGN